MVTKSCEQYRQRGESLLAVHNEILLHSDSPDVRAGCEHKRANEVRSGRFVPSCARELNDVVPQLVPLSFTPGIHALVERYLVLLLALQDALEVGLLRVDHGDPPACPGGLLPATLKA